MADALPLQGDRTDLLSRTGFYMEDRLYGGKGLLMKLKFLSTNPTPIPDMILGNLTSVSTFVVPLTSQRYCKNH